MSEILAGFLYDLQEGFAELLNWLNPNYSKSLGDFGSQIATPLTSLTVIAGGGR